jgi:hypothetical protein
MLNELSPLEHCHLSEPISHLYAHEVATNGSTIALTATTAFHDVGIEHRAFACTICPRASRATTATPATLVVARFSFRLLCFA